VLQYGVLQRVAACYVWCVAVCRETGFLAYNLQLPYIHIDERICLYVCTCGCVLQLFCLCTAPQALWQQIKGRKDNALEGGQSAIN